MLVCLKNKHENKMFEKDPDLDELYSDKRSSGQTKLNIKSDKVLEKIFRLAMHGTSKKGIACRLGIHHSTFTKYLADKKVEEAFNAGREAGIAAVEESLYNNAVEKMNVTAQLKFLERRCPERWGPIESENIAPININLYDSEKELC